MTQRLLWIAAIAVCVVTFGVQTMRPAIGFPYYLTFEPALALVSTLFPDAAAPKTKSPQPNLGTVGFGSGDVCCPGIPARNTINIASGEVMKRH